MPAPTTSTIQFSVWENSAFSISADVHKDEEIDENEQKKRRKRRLGACYGYPCCCCCPCSAAIMIGFLIGALVAGIVLATILSVYLVGKGKSTSTSTPMTETTFTTTTATTSTSSSSTSSTSSTTTTTTITTITTSSTSTTSTSTSSSSSSTRSTSTSSSTSSTSSTSTTTTTSSSSSSTSSTSTSSTTSTTTRTTTTTTTTQTTTTTTTQTTTTTSTETTATSTTTSTATTSTVTTATTTTTSTTTTTAPYCLTHVTFDDIPGQVPPSGVAPNGYDNFNWTNAIYLDASTVPNSGYQTLNSATSAPYVAYNPGGLTMTALSANGTTFSFDSVVVSAAWRDGLSWTIRGYRGAAVTIAGTFSMNSMNRTTISCGSCTGLTRLTFSATGGIPRPGLAENGTEFAIDDLCVSFGY